MTKTKLLFVIALAAFTLVGMGHSQAQYLNPGPRFGIKGGLNLAQLFADQPSIQEENIKAGLHFGFFGKIPMTDYVSLQPEVLYTNMGSNITYGQTQLENLFGVEEGEVRFNLNYIQVPLALAVNIGTFNIHAGPYASYLISANISNLNVTDLSTNQLVDLNENDFNRWDYGVLIGVGADIGNINFGIRYNHGLREVGSTNLAGTLTNNSRNSVLQVYLGLGFKNRN